jgi:hypothetical protein
MHTCLTLTNVSGHEYVEHDVSGLIESLQSYCESIRSCDVSVEGPSGEGELRCWRVELKVRVFDEIVRVATRAPEGSEPRQSFARVLGEVYARARVQLDHISDQHHSCCARGGEDLAVRPKACA